MKIDSNFVKRHKFRLIAGALLLVCAGYFTVKTVIGNSPEAKIRKTLNSLCHAASKTEEDGTSAMTIKTLTMYELFAPATSLELRPSTFNGTYSPEEIASNMVRYRALFQYVRLDMRDLFITIESPTRAEAEFTGVLDGLLKGGDRIHEIRELVCSLEYLDDKWKVSAVKIKEILEK